MKRRTRLVIAASCAVAVFAAPSAAYAETQHHVVTGDTLWAIGIANHTTWQALAAYNHIQNPNLIFVDQIVKIPPKGYVAPELPAPPAPTPVVTQAPAPVHHYQNVTTLPTRTTYRPSYNSGFQACVATRESGNGSGSSNIYGILDSTWRSLGRSGSAWSASRAEQDAAFAQLYAMDGTSPWAPYDGC